jgi:hypothetical protein
VAEPNTVPPLNKSLRMLVAEADVAMWRSIDADRRLKQYCAGTIPRHDEYPINTCHILAAKREAEEADRQYKATYKAVVKRCKEQAQTKSDDLIRQVWRAYKPRSHDGHEVLLPTRPNKGNRAGRLDPGPAGHQAGAGPIRTDRQNTGADREATTKGASIMTVTQMPPALSKDYFLEFMVYEMELTVILHRGLPVHDKLVDSYWTARDIHDKIIAACQTKGIESPISFMIINGSDMRCVGYGPYRAGGDAGERAYVDCAVRECLASTDHPCIMISPMIDGMTPEEEMALGKTFGTPIMMMEVPS